MLDIHHLQFSYRKGKPLLKDLNFRLEPGHIYGLLGKNGSGKTTLLKNIAGLTFSGRGHCFLNGKSTATRSVAVLKEMYFIGEEAYVPHLTAMQFARSTGAFYPLFSNEEFRQFLQAFEVDGEYPMHRMSYGQQKKALICFALATNCRLLILDEPTNGLDIPSKAQFRKVIASAITADRCIIISTHQVRDLDNLIDYLLILENGELLLSESIDALMQKLQFGIFEQTTGMPLLYEEKGFRGSHAILRNNGDTPGKIDLELLFNGITSATQPLLEFLNSSQHE